MSLECPLCSEPLASAEINGSSTGVDTAINTDAYERLLVQHCFGTRERLQQHLILPPARRRAACPLCSRIESTSGAGRQDLLSHLIQQHDHDGVANTISVKLTGKNGGIRDVGNGDSESTEDADNALLLARLQALSVPTDVDDGLSDEQASDVRRRVRAAKSGEGALFIVLGSGPSTGCPRIPCLIERPVQCAACLDAVRSPHGGNARHNPSAALKLPNGQVLLIDCGKTFRSSIVSCLSKCIGASPELTDIFEYNHIDHAGFPENYHHMTKENDLGLQYLVAMSVAESSAGEVVAPRLSKLAPASCPLVESQVLPRIERIDSVLLTHSHADACYGLDDLREYTEQNAVSVYARPQDHSIIAGVFPYLANVDNATGSGYVSLLKFESITGVDTICGTTVHSLEVEHGLPSTSLAFVIGRLVYMSDVSLVPDDVRKRILDLCGGQSGIELLVLDVTTRHRHIRSHFMLSQALAEIRRLRPRRSLIVGMTHDLHFMRDNRRLRELEAEGLNVELAYDGQCVWLDSVTSVPVTAQT